MSDFDKDFNKNAPKSRKLGAITCGNVAILIKIPTKCAKGPQVIAQLLAAMSDFDKDSNKMRQRAASLIYNYKKLNYI
jgi:hypothetical protein